MDDKIIIYQVFTRLFGNHGRDRAHRDTPNVRGGTVAENGVGKFADFTPEALRYIRDLGATHVWYTGVIEHSTCTPYPGIGCAASPEGVVKGRAGSPYAIRDYYNVDPDLALDPDGRMAEFEALVARTHRAGLKVLMDFVPNHVARDYRGTSRPPGVRNLGEDDWRDWHFRRDNNFYYCVGEPFRPQFDAKGYEEFPARATGNDCFSPSPGVNDWYETVKLNYGVDYCGGRVKHFSPIPDTWLKMKDILLFWAGKGVDGFRCDMAEMVPVEFWHWAIAEVKGFYPQMLFIAEVYNPSLYRSYLYDGGFDFLYDKVGMYDTLRSVMCGGAAREITRAWQATDDIRMHMLRFLENHDEQRIASRQFAGDARAGRAAMAVAAHLNAAPVMIYFAQELGERAAFAEGFSGDDGRTSIFDYWRMDNIARLIEGSFTDKCLDADESALLDCYRRLLRLCRECDALRSGEMYDLTWLNEECGTYDTARQFAWLRHTAAEVVLCVANFSPDGVNIKVNIGQHAFDAVGLVPRSAVEAADLMTGAKRIVTLSPDKPLEVYVGGQDVLFLKLR